MAGVVVIGAGPGIGTSVAVRFAKEGFAVALIARSEGTVDEATAAVRSRSDVDVIGIRADATDEAGLRAALDEAGTAHGVPDVLVYNAARIRADRIDELGAPDLLDTLAVNVVGAAVAAGHVAPAMAARRAGTILITGGMPEPKPGYASLSLGKAGVRSLVDLLHRQFGADGVHVASVTVTDAVAPDTAFDPDRIAEAFVELHAQPPGAWEHERVFDGS